MRYGKEICDGRHLPSESSGVQIGPKLGIQPVFLPENPIRQAYHHGIDSIVSML